MLPFSVRSLGMKLTLSLLLTSLISLALVGFMTNRVLFQRFNQLVLEESFTEYQSDVQSYFNAYGNWGRGQAIEPFRDFVWRSRRAMAESGTQSKIAPLAAPGQIGATNSFPNPPAPNAPFGAPPRPGRPQPNGPNPGNPNGGPPPGEPGGPMFRFLLLDPSGRVLMGSSDEPVGEMASLGVQAQARPIVVDGQTVAQAVPMGQPNLSASDRSYLAAMRQALLTATALATLLALGLGVLFGHRLSSQLRELTSAFDEMGRGQLRQQVEVKTDDELGMLALAFNQMSHELADSHDKLQSSHEKIELQALQLREASIRDALTGLYNRRYFDEQVAPIWAGANRYGQPLTLMIGDIDFFKKINDGFSHAIGDQVLRHVAQILARSVRESDILARYGGEEFVLALPQTNLAQAAELCERLRARIEAYEWHRIAPGLKVTMSMGLCDDKRQGAAEKMLAFADTQLYEAKRNGRNQVRFAGIDGALQPVVSESVTMAPVVAR